MKLAKISGAIVSAMVVFPIIAMAQVTPPSGIITGYDTGTSGGLVGIIRTATSWLFGILLLAAVVFLIYAAFLYLTSGGDEEKTKKAKSYVIYAVIAIAIGLLAQGIIALVYSLLGQTYTPQ
jgi:threonine/homoserine/homoserine lactone efflux protein